MHSDYVTVYEKRLLHLLSEYSHWSWINDVYLSGKQFDLVEKTAKIIIEVDGAHHMYDPTQKRYDEIKESIAEENGYVVLRFSNDQVFKCSKAFAESDVFSTIWNKYRERMEELGFYEDSGDSICGECRSLIDDCRCPR